MNGRSACIAVLVLAMSLPLQCHVQLGLESCSCFPMSYVFFDDTGSLHYRYHIYRPLPSARSHCIIEIEVYGNANTAPRSLRETPGTQVA
jgi:hypothetical protein